MAVDEHHAVASGPDCEVLLLDQSLTELAAFDPRRAQIVEMRYFGGLSEQDVAEVLTLSRSTVTREWQRARAWLYRASALARIDPGLLAKIGPPTFSD